MTNKKFLIGMPVLLIAALFFLGCPSGDDGDGDDPGPSKVTGTALALDSHVVTPAQGAEAGDGVIDAAQYTGTVTWNKPLVDGKFAASTEYTAAVALTVKDGNTFEGVGSFTHDGGEASQTTTGTGIKVTIVFPVTLTADDKPNKVTAYDLTALITRPAKNAAPQTAFAGPAQYSGTITWTKAADDSPAGALFGANTEYKAAVELTAKTGWTFEGVAAGAFSYSAVDAKSYTNSTGTAASTLLVTIVFKATAGTATEPGPVNATELDTAIAAPVTGAEPGAFTPDTDQYTVVGAVSWNPAIPADGKFAGSQVYAAEVTLRATEGYIFENTTAFTYGGALLPHVPNTGLTETAVTIAFAVTDTVVNGAALNLANAFVVPVTGAEPDGTFLAFTSPGAGQYTGPASVVWTPGVAEGGTFAANTDYTATVTLEAEDGFTFATLTGASWTGLPAGATAAFDAATGVLAVTVKTAAVVNSTVLTARLDKPVKTTGTAGNALKTVDNAQYTGAVAWKTVIGNQDTDFAVGTQFGAATVYKAEVTLTPAAGFTFVGFAGTFSYAGLTAAQIVQPEEPATVDADTVKVTLTFPATGASETKTGIEANPVIAVTASGGADVDSLVIDKSAEENVTLTASDGFSDYKWYLNGNPAAVSATNTLELDPDTLNLNVREHSLTVEAVKDGKLYATKVPFTVTAGI